MAQARGGGQPRDFQKGVAISVWQNTADNDLSNWTRYAYSSWPFSSFPLKYLCWPISTTQGSHKVGKSCNFWHRWVLDAAS